MKPGLLQSLIICLLAIGLLSTGKPKTEQSKDTKNEVQPFAAAINKNKKKGFIPLFNGKDFTDWELLLRDGTPEEIKKVYTIDEWGILHYFRDLPEGFGSETRMNAFHDVMVW